MQQLHWWVKQKNSQSECSGVLISFQSNDYSRCEFSEVQKCLGFMRQAACIMCHWHLFQYFKVINHQMCPKNGGQYKVNTAMKRLITNE